MVRVEVEGHTWPGGASPPLMRRRGLFILILSPRPSPGFQPPEPGPLWSLFTELAGAAERQLASVLPFAVTHFISYSYWSAAALTRKRRREGNSRRGAVLKGKGSIAGCVASRIKPGGRATGTLLDCLLCVCQVGLLLAS